MALLRKAYENFRERASSELKEEFTTFCQSKAYWLEDYALFMALKDNQGGKSWNQWEPELAHRKQEALEKVVCGFQGRFFPEIPAI